MPLLHPMMTFSVIVAVVTTSAAPLSLNAHTPAFPIPPSQSAVDALQTPQTITVTPKHHEHSLSLGIGDRVILALEADLAWLSESSNEQVVTRISGPSLDARGGIFEVRGRGTATIRATGRPPCNPSVQVCSPFMKEFTLHIIAP